MLYTPRNLHIEVHQVLCLYGSQVLCVPRNLQTSHMSKSHDSLHLSRNQSASKITTMFKVLRLPQNLHFESRAAPILCTCHEKPTLDHHNTRFPLRLPRKVTTMSENARGTTTRARSLEAPAAATQILQACAVEMHVDDFERYECTINSSKLAVHARASAILSISCFISTTVRTP